MSTFNSFSFSGKRAIVRVDFNVPMDKTTGLVADDKRIRAALPTIQHILKNGGSVVLLSHFGRPKNGPESVFSMAQICDKVSEVLGVKVQFATDCISEEAFEKSKALQPGEVLLLENVRFYAEETAGDTAFAKKLALHGDCYVNDAFGAAHRAHASTTQLASFFPNAKMAGLLMNAEIENAKKVLLHAERPFTAIVGGAKVSDKILIVENLLNLADHIIIGGGMAYTFWKAQGKMIGSSLCEEDRLELAAGLLQKAKQRGVNIHLPVDSTIADKFAADATTSNCESFDIPAGWMGLDIGQKARIDFQEVILSAQTILWNGPMGVFEMKPFQAGTLAIAKAVADATDKGAFSLVGGGDSVAAVNQFGFADRVSYVSTGGGALLEYFEGKVLPGIAAVQQS
jgi:phosphoglycerate kinase